MRPIDADELMKKLGMSKECEACDHSYHCLCGNDNNIVDCCEAINEAPTIDAVEVVRCKDCKWWWKEWETCTHKNLVDGYTCATTFKADCFCSYGERKEREGE